MPAPTPYLSPESISRRNLLELGIHGAWFVVINLALVLINLTFTPEVLWFYWGLLGWSFGLTGHAVQVLTVETLPKDERYLVSHNRTNHRSCKHRHALKA